jgi:hypothetical protein
MAREKKKKVDYVALASPFMRIPRMDVRAARALLDMGVKEVYELKGRDPASLLADYSKIKKPDDDFLKYFTLAVEFAEDF